MSNRIYVPVFAFNLKRIITSTVDDNVPQHFFGTIVLLSSNGLRLDIIDGQQRGWRRFRQGRALDVGRGSPGGMYSGAQEMAAPCSGLTPDVKYRVVRPILSDISESPQQLSIEAGNECGEFEAPM